MKTEIKGGKLFLDGNPVDLTNDGSVLVGENLLCSAGVLYVNGDCVHQFTMEEFNELKSHAD